GVGVGEAVEVPGVDEGGNERAALRRPVAILDGQRDVADVEVEGVAVQQQEERRHEDEYGQRPPIARDLAQLLAGDGQRLMHVYPRGFAPRTPQRARRSTPRRDR